MPAKSLGIAKNYLQYLPIVVSALWLFGGLKIVLSIQSAVVTTVLLLATVGVYGFASAALYRGLYDEAYHAGGVEEVGGERYVAPMYQLLLRQGKSVCAPKLDLPAVHVLGTPLEVQAFDSMVKPHFGAS